MDDPVALERRADKILLAVRKTPNRAHKLTSLSRRFRFSVTDVTEALNTIVQWGYSLVRTTGQVTFLKAPDLLTATEIGYHLKSKVMGQVIHAYQAVKSTNDIAAELAAAGAPEGTIITAENQTSGRGRFSRSWHSPPNTGIYVSIILRPSFPSERAPGMSIMTALALADAVESYCPDRTQIKWPNDVLVSGRKVAGILTELAAEGRRIDHVIIGVGVNVNQRAGDFPSELRASATSLRRSTRRKQSRVALLAEFLTRLENEYEVYQKHGLSRSRTRLRGYSSLIGHRVKLALGRKIVEGMAVDIGADGNLMVDTQEGVKSVSSGEVTVVKE